MCALNVVKGMNLSMAKYKWDLYEIRNNINILKELLKNENNPYIKEQIKFYINVYNTILQLAINKITVNDFDDELFGNIDFDNIKDLIKESILSYKDNNRKVLDIILNSYLVFQKEYSDKFIMKEIPISDTNEEIIMIAEDFSKKMLPTRLSDRFIGAIKDNVINISYAKENKQYSGTTFFDPTLNKKYVYVSRTNNIIDLVVLPHELFHYLYSDSNITITEKYNTFYNGEVEGSLANLLFSEYFYENFLEDRNHFNEFFLERYYCQVTELIITNCMLDASVDERKIRLNKFNKNLNYLSLKPFKDEKEILDYLATPLDINMMYTFGYLVAIDLYYIYKKDPDLAFYLLKNIKYIKQDNDILGLLRRNGITFMDDEYENLKKYIKKIERQSE